MTKAAKACAAPDDETVKSDPAVAPPTIKADPMDEEECIAEGNDPEACAEAADTGVPVEQSAKAEGDEPPAPEAAMPDEAEAQAPPAIALPAAVKDAVLGGLAQMLDSLTDVAEMVNAATVDDSAPIPPELTQALSDCGSMCQGLVDQASAPPADGAPPPDGAMAEEKALVSGAAAGVSKAIATALRPGYVAKAGRKMAAARLSMLKQAHDILLGLLKELMDETSGANGGAPPPPAPAQRQPPPPPAPAQKALVTSTASRGSAVSLDTVSKQLAEVMGLLKRQGETIQEHSKVVAQFQKAQGTPRSTGLPEGGPPPSNHAPPVVWGSDLAVSAQQRRAATSGAAPGAK